MAIIDSKVTASLLSARRVVPLLLLAAVLLNISFAGTARATSCSYPNSNINVNVGGTQPPGPVDAQYNGAGGYTFTVNWGGSESSGDTGAVFYIEQSSTPSDPCSVYYSGNSYGIESGIILPSGSLPTTINTGGPVGGSGLTLWVAAVDLSNNQATDWVQVNLLPVSGGTGGGSSVNGIVGTVCSIYTAVSTAIFILGLMLMILGGTVYAGSHFVPGQTRGQLQGYAMGMVLGGLIGVIIAVMAPYVLGLITGNTMLTTACV